MPEIYTWVERKFDFHLTIGMYMPAVERVRGTPARIEERVQQVPKEILTKKSSDEVWSIQENIDHLLSNRCLTRIFASPKKWTRQKIQKNLELDL